MHRGLRLGLIWFGALAAVGTFAGIVAAGRNVFAAALMALLIFLVLAWYPVAYARKLVPAGDTLPRSSVRWSDREVATFTFAFLVGATIVIIGVVLEEIVLGGAGGLAAFFLLGVFPAVWMRRRRHRAPPEPVWEPPEPEPQSDEILAVTDELHPATKVLNVLLWIALVPAAVVCLLVIAYYAAVAFGLIDDAG